MAASMSPLVTRPSLPVPWTVDVDAALGRDLAHRRRDRHFGGGCGGFRAGCRPAWLLGGHLLGRTGRARPPAWWRSPGAGLGGGGAFGDLAEQRADRDGLAVLDRDLGQHAGGRRRHFDGHLVGFELDQRLVDGDGSPGCLNHWPMVASVTDSPRVGTRMSVMMHCLSLDLPAFAMRTALCRASRLGPTRSRPP